MTFVTHFDIDFSDTDTTKVKSVFWGSSYFILLIFFLGSCALYEDEDYYRLQEDWNSGKISKFEPQGFLGSEIVVIERVSSEEGTGRFEEDHYGKDSEY